ncbi:AAA family ATPase [Planctomycetota bacterium]
MARVRGIDLDGVPLLLLDVAALSLGRRDQLDRLRATLAEHSPRLLVLDPFVRLSDVDENSSTEVSHLLGSLRALQREFALSVVLVHHMRKAPSRDLGQRLRGSSDFAAWHDSALFLTPARDHKVLTVEHRRARAPGPFRLRLVNEPTPCLELLPDEKGAPPARQLADTLQAEILSLLRASHVPLSTQELRRSLARRKASVVAALHVLRETGRVERNACGWLTSPPNTEGQRHLFPCSQP